MTTNKMKKLSLFAVAVLMSSLAFANPNSFSTVPPERTLDIQKLINSTPNGKTVTIPFGTYILKKSLIIRDKSNMTITSQPGTRILTDSTELDVLMLAN